MIRGAVIHMAGDQPLVADLPALPSGGDQVLLCTNLRLSGGARPTYIARSDDWFVIPLLHVRFVEIPAAEAAAAGIAGAVPALEVGAAAATEDTSPPASPEGNADFDEDLLRRIRET